MANVILDNKTIAQPVADAAARNAIPTADLADGLIVVEADTKSVYEWDGTEWTQLTPPADFFDDGTITQTWSGALTAVSGNMSYDRSGDVVTLSVPTLSANADTTATIVSDNAIEASLRPAKDVTFVVQVEASGVKAFGTLTIGTDGILTFGNGETGGTFTSALDAGFYATSVTYSIKD